MLFSSTHQFYPPFARSVRLNNRQLIENSLVKVNGHFEIDFEQLERDIVENDVKLYVFCSPHNPGGRVWTKEELTKVADLCQKHGVLLVSDEIHQDLALYGNKHISMNTISDAYKDFTLVLSSATKTFNIAGTKTVLLSLKMKTYVKPLNKSSWQIINMKFQPLV